MTSKILIVKLGALGDVVRTTPLLRVLNGEIDWVTSKPALPLLEGNPFIEHLFDIDQFPQGTGKSTYDLIISLDEEERAVNFASAMAKKELIGTYVKSGKISYTDSAREWFDMSLISRFGGKRADELKWHNHKSWQEILFGMLGKKFNGEEYVLPNPGTAKRSQNGPVIGIEHRSGERWIGKRWPRADEFVKLLEKNGHRYVKFDEAPSLTDFMAAVSETDVVVSTDTLTLHLALGYKKKVVAIFAVTNPYEIYDYSRMVRVVSPLLKKYFIKASYKSLAPGEAISPETVYKAVQSLISPRNPGEKH